MAANAQSRDDWDYCSFGIHDVYKATMPKDWKNDNWALNDNWEEATPSPKEDKEYVPPGVMGRVFAYEPREQFLPLHQRDQRWAAIVAHRRAGKTVACVNELVLRALYCQHKAPRYAYIAPFYSQAKNIAWEYLKEAARPFIKDIKDIRESELSVKLINGAVIRLYGADNINALRGIYLHGVVLDEFGDCRPGLWAEVILPTLSDHKGWAIIIGTPKGKNTFFHMLELARKNPKEWYYSCLKASETGIIEPEELASLKKQMSEAQYDQEMECSFTAPVLGTFYAGIIQTLEKKGNIYNKNAAYDDKFPVFVAMDLGFKDSTAIWFWQERPDGFAIIDYEEGHGLALAEYYELLDGKGYKYEKIWLPHDARAKTLQTGRSTIEQFLEQGYPADIVPFLKVQQGIDAVRLILHECHFAPGTELGVEGLRAYRREYDEEKKVFRDKPLHDWASNPADGFRYLSLVAQKFEGPMSAVKANVEIILPASYTLDELFKDRENSRTTISSMRI